MRKLIARKLIALFLTFAAVSIAQAATLEFNPEIGNLEKSLETKIQEGIRTLFGDDIKIVPRVHVKERPFTLESKGSNDPNERGIDIGYIPMPLFPNGRDISGNSRNPNLLIDSVEVDLQVPKDLDSALIDSAKEMVNQTLKGLNPKITVTKLSGTDRPLPAKKEPPIDLRTLLPYIALLVAALLLALGIFSIGNAVTVSATAIVEGFRAIRTSSQTSQEKPMVLEHKGLNPPDDAKNAKGLPGISTPLKDYSRNIRVIKELLKDAPMTFIQGVQDRDSEWRGLKWLLPALTVEEQAALKRYLGTKRLNKMAQIESTSEDQTVWLQDFVERLMVKKVQGGSSVEKNIGPEKSAALTLADQNRLVQAAKAIDSRASWRILAEFVRKDDFEKLVNELSESQWQNLITAADVTPDEIRSTADQILLQVATGNEEQGAQAEERTQYYSKSLLEPAVASVLSKGLGEDDLFLDSLQTSAPALVALIRERVWTPRTLARVPKEFLSRATRGLNNEQKAAIIVALPKDHAEEIERMLPEGNIRTIVLDRVKKMKARGDATELKNATTVTRQFLEFLRRQCADKKFQLAEDQGFGTPPPQVDTPPVTEAA